MNAKRFVVRGGLLTLLAVWMLWGTAAVPFHPDETTRLHISHDLELLFTQPSELIWSPGWLGTGDQSYRLLDAPLASYWLGLVRWATGFSAETVATDWNWSETWAENVARGALPSAQLLTLARLAMALVLCVGVASLYRALRQFGELTAWLACGLVALNSLVLLHGRRAMAEGWLITAVCLCLWALQFAPRRPFVAGVLVALALSAKQSLLAFAPLVALAVLWPIQFPISNLRSLIGPGVRYTLGLSLVFLALNPLYWANPLGAVQAAARARQDFTERQVALLEQIAPDQIIRNPVERAAILAANLFIQPPAFYDAANYAAETAPQEARYLQRPGHVLLRDVAGGLSMLMLALFGGVAALLALRRAAPAERRWLILLLLATFSQAATIIIAIPTPIQRYVMPLAPLACLWIAYGVGRLACSIRPKL